MRQAEEKVVKPCAWPSRTPTSTPWSPLKKSVLPSGVVLHEMLSRTKDGSRLFAQFGAIGPTTAILVTVEANTTTAASVDAIRDAVVAIGWK